METSIKNYFYQTAYQLIIAITPLVTAPHLARSLGTTGIGIYSYTSNLANYFLMFAMLGMANYGSRYIAQHRENKEKLSYSFWSIYFCQFICTSIMFFLYIVYLAFICDVDILVSILQGLLVLSGFFDVCWFFRGLEDFETIIRRNIVIKIVIVVSILLFVNTRNDVYKYAIIMSGGILLSQFLIFTQIRKYLYFVLPKFHDILFHLKPNIILFLPEITSSLYNSMDKLMVGRMSIMSELGLYENAEKLTGIPTSLITSIGVVLLPRISNLLTKGDKKRADAIFDISYIYVIFLGIGLVFGLLGVSNVFVPLFFGEEFIGILDLLPYLAPSIVFLCLVTNIRSQVLLPNGLDRQYLISTVLGAVTNLVLNLLLIPQCGAMGASIATLVAYIVLFIFQGIIASKYVNLLRNFMINIPFIFFGIAMYIVIVRINFINNIKTVLIRIFVGGSIYCILSFIYMLIFRKKEFKIIISFVKIKMKEDK